MKRLLVLFFILLAGCHLKKGGKLVPNTPAILLGKEIFHGEYSAIYRLVFYIDNDAYGVSVSKEFYDRYSVGDTLHGYQVIPNK